jgi:arsenate reductase
VITLCDQAREDCPQFPGRALMAHWGMSDPAAVVGDSRQLREAFREALQLISRRLDLLLALPSDALDRRSLQDGLRRIGETD